MNWLKNILRVCAIELRKALTDTGAIVFFFAVPLLYPLLYAYLYGNEVVREVPIVVVDDSRTTLSREFLRKADATPDIHIISYCADMEEARELIRRHKAYGLIQIPKEFTKELADGHQSTINLYCDMSGLLYYKCLLSGCTLVSLDMNRDIKMQRLSGLSDREMETFIQPVANEYVTLFNPQNGFATFLIPAVLILVLQQTLVLGIAMLSGTEKEKRRRGELVLDESFASPMDVLAGKALCYVFLYAAVGAYVLCMVPMFFHMPQLWIPHDLVLTYIPFLLSSIFFAFTIANFVKDRESCFLLFVFISVPLIFMSGISWPTSNIPKFWRLVSYLFPSTFGVNAFVKLTNTGATLYQIRSEYITMWIQTGVYFITALLTYIRLYRSEKMPDLAAIKRRLEERERRRLEKLRQRFSH